MQNLALHATNACIAEGTPSPGLLTHILQYGALEWVRSHHAAVQASFGLEMRYSLVTRALFWSELKEGTAYPV